MRPRQGASFSTEDQPLTNWKEEYHPSLQDTVLSKFKDSSYDLTELKSTIIFFFNSPQSLKFDKKTTHVCHYPHPSRIWEAGLSCFSILGVGLWTHFIFQFISRKMLLVTDLQTPREHQWILHVVRACAWVSSLDELSANRETETSSLVI